MTIVFTWQGEENLLWTLVWWWWSPLWWLRSSPQWLLKSEVLRFPLMGVGRFPEGKVGEQWSKYKLTKHPQINTNTRTKNLGLIATFLPAATAAATTASITASASTATATATFL